MNRKWCALLLAAVMFLSLTGCGGVLRVGRPRPPVEWLLVFDVSESVPTHAFDEYRDAMCISTVFYRLRNKDRVHIIALDTNPDDDVHFDTITASKRDLHQKIYDLYSQRIRTLQPRSGQYGTDFGAVLRYLKSTIKHGAADRKESGDVTPQYRMLVFTDGYPDGYQTKDPETLDVPADVQIEFWGLYPPAEDEQAEVATLSAHIREAENAGQTQEAQRLKRQLEGAKVAREEQIKKAREVVNTMCQERGLSRARLQFVSYSEWKERASAFGAGLDRPVDEQLKRDLDRLLASPGAEVEGGR